MCNRMVFVGAIAIALLSMTTSSRAQDLSDLELLGKQIFFDENLSSPSGQSCATCHDPAWGFTGPLGDINASEAVYPGAAHHDWGNRLVFGNRKPPTAAYGGQSPVLFYDAEEDVFVGGMFFDGRATGWALGDPLAEQAQGPFLNNLEQNLPEARAVIERAAASDYAELFESVWGPGSLDPAGDIELAYERLARSIAAYERSSEVNPFTSKYDYYLDGLVELTPLEAQGLELFEGDAECSACHPSELGPNGERPLFTDFTYDNLGVPINKDNPFYRMDPENNPDGYDWRDQGLGGFLAGTEEWASIADSFRGAHKVPTLRNVDRRPGEGDVKAFMHNGVFKSLEEVVHFYNTRDVEFWPPAEVPENVNEDELGDLGLTADEEAAVVAFMRTLSDGYELPVRRPVVTRTPAAASLALRSVSTGGGAAAFAFRLATAGHVRLVLFDLRGHRVATLLDQVIAAGDHQVAVPQRDLASGVYLARAMSGRATDTARVTVVR